ncbi:MAG TPA: TonB-dependent receptor [Vicinamibacterales bacterium]|nr:TonB-dependent receptor [Vicinamibacterales bacterium]
MRMSAKCLVVVAILFLPGTVSAQAVLTGTVHDPSGAVLPGVTVEAASPALIEKTRTATTDGTGQYRIIDLQPGSYTLTFTLSGFTTVRRASIELSGRQTVTIPIEMRVGAIAETVTVTGETPLVDVQNAKREVVMNQNVIQALPVARAVGALLNATPGLTVDTNGPALSPTMTFFNAHSSNANSTSVAGEGRMTVNGMTIAAARSGGVSSYVYDTPNSEEIAVTVGAGLGENDIGGPVMNLVPRSGGNLFAGNAFFNEAGNWSRGNNLTDDLRAIGLTQTPGIIQAYDLSGSFGGPLVKDRLWFYGSYRNLDTQTAMEGITANANAGDASRWDWVGSPVNARLVQDRQMYIGRFTGQIGRSRITYSSEYQHRCEGTPLKVDTSGCHNRGADWIGLGNNAAPFQSPEATSTAARGYFDAPFYVNQPLWTMPVSNKLLLEAGYTAFRYNPIFGFPPPDGITSLIPVTEQSNAINAATGLRYAPQPTYTYRAVESWGWAVGKTDGWRASASYVTGAHNVKIGYQGNRLDQLDQTIADDAQLGYRFNQGVANAVSYYLPDFGRRTITKLHGIYIQDSWTRSRLTLQGALRYDRASSYAPVDQNGTTRTSFLNPTPITIQQTPGVDAYNDITPRVAVAYDLFGDGKTALKFNWGRYLAYAANDPPYTSTNPGFTVVRNVTNRGWTDSNNNKVVDCDLLNPGAQNNAATGGDVCAAAVGNQANFGKIGAATIVNPDVLHGWGRRPGDYQWAATVQQQILPRATVELSYTRRNFFNFFVTDDLNRDVNTAYESYTLTAPRDSRLPGGGGYPITVYTPTAAANAIPSKTYLTLESDYGSERTSYWHGVDFTVNARLREGFTASIGTSTGRSVIDDCAVATKYNQVNTNNNTAAGPDLRGCHSVDPFQTTLRGLATYIIPKIDVLVSAALRSQPPVQLGAAPAGVSGIAAGGNSAQWIVPNAEIAAALGHLPVGATPTGTTTIQLADNANRVYADTRRTQIDMRFAKVLRFRRTRSDIGLDLNNLLNTNYATGYNTTYTYSAGNTLQGGTWGNPTSLYTPRFLRINYTVNF